MKNSLKTLLSLLLMALFLYFAFRGTDFGKLWEILSHANYWWTLATLPVLVLSHAVRTWRWEYFLRPVKKNIKYRNLFSALMVGYMMNNILPRAGELVRPYAIGKLEGISRSAAFGTVLMERIFDVLSFMVLIVLIPLVYKGPLLQNFPWLEEAGIWIMVVTLLFLGLIIYLMVRRDLVERLVRFFTRRVSQHRAQLIERIVHSFLDGFLFVKEPKNYLMIGFQSIVVWGLYIVMMYLPFYSFGMVQKYNLGWSAAMVVQAISSIGIVIPTPGSVGPYHYFTIETLTKLYGVDEELARSYAAVTNAIGFIGITLIGAVYFFKDKLHMSEVMKTERTVQETATENV